MADTSLDEFFAKKDKSKKNKSKSKFTTTDTIAKKLEESGKKEYVKKEVKEKIPLTSNSSSAPLTTEQEDDEWKNIDDEKERDYSGLKVQSLSISDREKEEEQLKDQLAEQNDDQYKAGDGQSGPWKIVPVPTPPAEEEEEEEDGRNSPEVEVSEAPKPMAYKPPALRNAASSPSSVSSRRNPKSAPQITSELHFPSLSSAAKGKYSEPDKSFQSVKHGIRSKGETQPGLQLDLENKFSALHQGD